MGLAAHNYESTNGYLPPRTGQVIVNNARFDNGASPQALVLQYLEQSNKYNQFNFNFRVWDDLAPTGVTAIPNVNKLAREQDVPVYVCPSDPSSTQKASDWSNVANGAEGRLNYLGNLGTTSSSITTGPAAGIFSMTSPPAGQIMKGIPIVGIADGTSNTALWAEVMRTTHPWPAVSNVRDNTVIILDASVSGQNDTDGRSIPSCMAGGSPWFSSIKYMGLVYERSLFGVTFYNHTLPPNWNRNTGNDATQKFNCGDTAIAQFYVAPSSYHSGGVNLCMADGSVRFVTDGIKFEAWQAMGTRSGGDLSNE
jgi:prepilin-type processing-associated H-X9-DG protein